MEQIFLTNIWQIEKYAVINAQLETKLIDKNLGHFFVTLGASGRGKGAGSKAKPLGRLSLVDWSTAVDKFYNQYGKSLDILRRILYLCESIN